VISFDTVAGIITRRTRLTHALQRRRHEQQPEPAANARGDSRKLVALLLFLISANKAAVGCGFACARWSACPPVSLPSCKRQPSTSRTATSSDRPAEGIRRRHAQPNRRRPTRRSRPRAEWAGNGCAIRSCCGRGVTEEVLISRVPVPPLARA
jgi:hypothetical protein